MNLDKSKVKVKGGEREIGNKIGDNGERILGKQSHGMESDKANKGLATLCIGGGMGVAMEVERVK